MPLSFLREQIRYLKKQILWLQSEEVGKFLSKTIELYKIVKNNHVRAWYNNWREINWEAFICKKLLNFS